MTVVVRDRADLTLGNYERVAWQREDLEIAPGALDRMAECRKAFLDLLESGSGVVVYGTTSGAGDRARFPLSRDQQEAQGRVPPRRGTSWGEPFPDRVVRGIVFARLANLVEGHGAVRPELAVAIASMLGEDRMPSVPMAGNGGAGEVVALGHLFANLGAAVGTEVKEPMALINGSPCAASMVADCALRGRRLLGLAHHVFALSAEAMLAPIEAYDAALEDLWGDQHETAALRVARRLLEGGASSRRPYQAPVSWRIVPRMLGQLHRVVDRAAEAASTSLRSVSDNPVFIPPDAQHPHGRAFSTGGYHNAMAYPAIDALAASCADLSQLCERQVERFFVPAEWGEPPGLPIGYMVQAAWAEDARMAAQTTLVGLGGLGQNDTPVPTSFAYVKAQRVFASFLSALTVVAAVSSEVLARSSLQAPPALEHFLEEVRRRFPVSLERDGQSSAAAELNGFFESCTFSDDFQVEGTP